MGYQDSEVYDVAMVRLVATDETPQRFRHLHGTQRSYWWHRNGYRFVPGTPGYLFGIPGSLRETACDCHFDWVMGEDWPQPEDPGPPWARKLSADIAEIKALLSHDRVT